MFCQIAEFRKSKPANLYTLPRCFFFFFFRCLLNLSKPFQSSYFIQNVSCVCDCSPLHPVPLWYVVYLLEWNSWRRDVMSLWKLMVRAYESKHCNCTLEFSCTLTKSHGISFSESLFSSCFDDAVPWKQLIYVSKETVIKLSEILRFTIWSWTFFFLLANKVLHWFPFRDVKSYEVWIVQPFLFRLYFINVLIC